MSATPRPKSGPDGATPAPESQIPHGGVRTPRIRRRRAGRTTSTSDTQVDGAASSLGTKLYVGNLNTTTTEGTLKAAFSVHGRSVRNVTMPEGLAPGRAHSFAFVEMGSEREARAAVAELDGATIEGHVIEVDEVHSHPARGGRQPSARPREN